MPIATINTMANNGLTDIDSTIEELWVEATNQIVNIDPGEFANDLTS